MHAEEEYVVNPREMPHFSENSYVFVVFEFREMGLWSGITLAIHYLLMEEIWEKKENKYPNF
jgi:hypothetical protein